MAMLAEQRAEAILQELEAHRAAGAAKAMEADRRAEEEFNC